MKKNLSSVMLILMLIVMIIAGSIYVTADTGVAPDPDRPLPLENDLGLQLPSAPSNGNTPSNMDGWTAWDEKMIDPNAGTGTGAADIFLSIPNIKGECMDARYKDKIQVMAFSLGGSNESGVNVAKSFRIYKRTDISSPRLFQAFANEEILPTATIDVRMAGRSPVVVSSYILTDVYVVSFKQYNTGVKAGIDEIQLGYSKIEYVQTQMGPSGTATNQVKGVFDLN